ncbi:MAG: hypothetical protein LC723_06180 [Actinobacteria bacterium]|nr:hypothetical protein [Actinomycetota bacterium]
MYEDNLESVAEYGVFLNMMFNEWTQDELAYAHIRVIEPGYFEESS